MNDYERVCYSATINSIIWKKKKVPVKKNPFPKEEDEKW